MQTTHVYERDLLLGAATGSDSLSLIYALIAPGSKVLDVGAGTGGLGQALKSQKACQVHGLTYNEEELQWLASRYDLALKVDLEKDPLPSEVLEGAYDVIVCADVLEHLRNARDVLHALGRCLGPEGRIVVSVPNVSHLSVLTSLLVGRMPRTHEGLLDATHVHFFERSSLERLCKDAGMAVCAMAAVRKHMSQTEFSRLDYTALPLHVRQFMELQPDADVYQHVWTLRPASAGDGQTAEVAAYPVRPEVSLTARFEVRLYWDLGHGFQEAHAVTAWGAYTDEVVSVDLSLTVSDARVHAVRIDWPAMDGVFELEGVDCLADDGRLLASWRGQWGEGAELASCMLLPDLGPHGLPLMYLREPGASLRLVFEKSLPVAKVRVRMGAPRRIRLQQERLQDYQELVLPKLQQLQMLLLDASSDHTRQLREAFLNHQDLQTRHLETSLRASLNKSDQVLEWLRYLIDQTPSRTELSERQVQFDERLAHIAEQLTRTDQVLEWLRYVVDQTPSRSEQADRQSQQDQRITRLDRQLEDVNQQLQQMSSALQLLTLRTRPWWQKLRERFRKTM